jgi:hypothetical protein
MPLILCLIHSCWVRMEWAMFHRILRPNYYLITITHIQDCKLYDICALILTLGPEGIIYRII